ncbi:GNAT family N-acetyltransferase [Candidatus Allofournierella excrementigallinarum]|uniref:GNAT family N-acetyltransferase n=1 Tax=Candidatus Allofournierella excrementigallinarum TaxID=2838592 RepID=UPI00374E7ECA
MEQKQGGAVRLARPRDIEGWMELVERVKAEFPGLETAGAVAEHRAAVLDFIQNSSAVCAEKNGRIVGALLFSKESGTLCFLAVDPDSRRQHIARELVSLMLARMDEDRDVAVTTYREGDPRGAAARAFYKRMGFSEGEMGEEFGCPVQQFILRRARAGQT